jgi:hypothetical protein
MAIASAIVSTASRVTTLPPVTIKSAFDKTASVSIIVSHPDDAPSLARGDSLLERCFASVARISFLHLADTSAMDGQEIQYTVYNYSI